MECDKRTIKQKLFDEMKSNKKVQDAVDKILKKCHEAANDGQCYVYIDFEPIVGSECFKYKGAIVRVLESESLTVDNRDVSAVYKYFISWV